MSNLASALSGVLHEGIVTVSEMGLQGMVTVRADLNADGTAAAIKGVTGADLPKTRAIAYTDHFGVAWMGPDELLILCPHGDAEDLAAAMSNSLKDQHFLAVNVSDARAMFEIAGQAGAVRDTLAKVTPADMAQDVLGPQEMRRTRMAQVPVAIWFDDINRARVICFRSVAQYVFDVLSMAAKNDGAVNYHQPTV